MVRISENDSVSGALVKMSDGSQGATAALGEIMSKHKDIDPQSSIGPLGVIKALDLFAIYGKNISNLWKDKCGRDIRKVLLLIRGVQFGKFSHTRLILVAHDRTGNHSITDDEFLYLDKYICLHLSKFQRPRAASV